MRTWSPWPTIGTVRPVRSDGAADRRPDPASLPPDPSSGVAARLDRCADELPSSARRPRQAGAAPEGLRRQIEALSAKAMLTQVR